MAKVSHLTTITTGPGFLGDFVLLLLKTCSLYHLSVWFLTFEDQMPVKVPTNSNIILVRRDY